MSAAVGIDTPSRVVVFAYVLVALSFALTLWLEQAYQPELLHREDGIIESATALLFALAAVLFTLAYRRARWPLNLLFAALFVFAAGEEISWGQRLFDWQTPEVLQTLNVQQETNLHNLAGLHGKLEHLFNAFCLLYMLLLPLLANAWPALRRRCERWRVPLAPPAFGLLLALNTLLAMAVYFSPQVFQDTTRHAVSELRETHIALIFTLFAWLEYRRRPAVPAPR